MFRLNDYIPLLAFLFLLRSLLLAEDQVIGYAPEEPLFINQTYPRGLKEEDLRNLPLSDPKLRVAYAFLVRTALGGPKIVDERTPEMVEVLNDLTRRGDNATPLLIDIMAKNRNTRHEHLIPLIVSRIGSFTMEPYLEYLREMLRSRPAEISAVANEVAAKIFLEHGTAEDMKMMEELAKKRPFLAPSLERAFKFQEWKNPDRSKETPSALVASHPIAKLPEPKETANTKSAPIPLGHESTSSMPWGIMVLIVAATGLLWLLLNRRTK